jgi:[acyl-carrier-protein] S-malonyltransferase
MLDRVGGADSGGQGGMLAVAASPADLEPFLDHPLVTVAAMNAARQTMIAGPTAPLARIAAALEAAEFTVRPVPATHPFHSPAMSDAAVEAEVALAGLDLRPPRTPIWSGYTGGHRMTGGDATSPRFWAQQVVKPVDFLGALNAVSETGGLMLVECGAGQTLSSFARRHRGVRTNQHAVVPVLPAVAGPPEADRGAARAAFASLWREGHDIDPAAIADL